MKKRTAHLVLGVDISKLSFDVALLNGESVKTQKFKNDDEGFQSLVSWLALTSPESVHICMEATGRYYEPLANFLFANGFLVSVVNAAKVKGHAFAELRRSKTDKLDAALIARFCQKYQPPGWQPQPTEIREVQEAERYLLTLKSARNQEQNRLKSGLVSDFVRQVIEKHIQQIEMNIEEIKEFLRAQLKKHEKLARHFELVTSIIGIGEVTAFIWLGELGYCESFKHCRQLEAYAGLSTKQVQSGSSVHGRERMSKVGNHYLRRAFFMPAMSAMRSNPNIQEFMQRLRANGKVPKVIVGAEMRKLLRYAFGVIKSGKPFELGFQPRSAYPTMD